MSKKVWGMIGALCVAAAAVVAVCVALTGGENEAYRSIMVYQINGNATITRESVGEMAAYENLMLQSGDSVAVASESSLRLKLDEDKYILAEQDTLMNIVAEGDNEDSKTYIDLQRGSVTSEIQNKLKDGASYEVNTPNSIMAVRGTIFRVDVEIDESGNPYTKLTVFQGTVAAKAVMPDGTISDEEVLVEAGNELTIEGTPATFEDLSTPEGIDYDSLPPIVTEYIEELEQSGTKLAYNVTGNDAVENAADVQEPEQNAEAPETHELEQQNAGQADSGEPENQEAGQSDGVEKPQENRSETPEEPQMNPSEAKQPESEQQMTEQPEAVQSETELQKQEPQETEKETESKSESQSNPQDPGSQTEPSSSQDSSDEGSSGKTQYCTVTFQYNGSTFGTQKVKKGEKATEPKLCPTPNGSWEYDFSNKVNKNLVIQWKEQ